MNGLMSRQTSTDNMSSAELKLKAELQSEIVLLTGHADWPCK